MSDILLNNEFIDFASSDDSDSQNNEFDQTFALENADELLNSRNLVQKSYSKRSGGAVNESEKEFELFSFFLSCGSGRSTLYLANIFNFTESKLLAISKKNNWAQRASDYDIDMLQQKLKLEQDSRAIEHKKRLEEYRLQQEFLGRNLSANAAKLAALSQRTLDEYLQNDRAIDIRDIPSVLNSAAKIAEVGKNLQSGALGVEQLLVALEEADFDE